MAHRLRGNPLGDVGLAFAGKISSLEKLDISDTHFTDAGLVHLKKLKALKELYLSGTLVTDAGLLHLKTLTNLKKLILFNISVTREGGKKLKQALPDLVISYPLVHPHDGSPEIE
jgi:Leucine-rich repeat (LRR) protein